MRRFLLAASLVAGGGMTASAQAQNLIQNPGFETGDLSSWLVDPFNAGRTQVVAYSGSYCCQGATPPEGTFAAAFGGGGATDGELAQTFSTTVGATYNVSLRYAGVGDGVATLQVTVGDANTFTPYSGFPVPLTPAYNGSFQTFNGTFVAGSSLSGIDIVGLNNGGGSADVLVDNVQVTLVPEPALAGTLAVAGLAMALRCRRRA